jgi:hypothetical protein
MPRLLIVHHTPSPALQEMFEAVVSGSRTDEIEGVEVVIRPALTAAAADVLQADGFLLGTPANIGYMSGALKHFFDGIYYPCLEATRRRPYGLYVHGGMDTGGAVRAVESITTGLQWRAVRPPVCVTGPPAKQDLEACWELGALLAAEVAGPLGRPGWSPHGQVGRPPRRARAARWLWCRISLLVARQTTALSRRSQQTGWRSNTTQHTTNTQHRAISRSMCVGSTDRNQPIRRRRARCAGLGVPLCRMYWLYSRASSFLPLSALASTDSRAGLAGSVSRRESGVSSISASRSASPESLVTGHHVRNGGN